MSKLRGFLRQYGQEIPSLAGGVVLLGVLLLGLGFAGWIAVSLFGWYGAGAVVLALVWSWGFCRFSFSDYGWLSLLVRAALLAVLAAAFYWAAPYIREAIFALQHTAL